MPSWSELSQFLVSGLALGGVYALSGVGLVVLYRATGVLYLAFGAVGAMGAFLTFEMVQASLPGWTAWVVCILFGGVCTLIYGMIFGPPLARRDPLVKAVATLGLTLVLFGAMNLLWPPTGGAVRGITLPTDNGGFTVAGLNVTWTQLIALIAGIVLTVGTALFLRYTKLGTAMRAMANDREITATLGVPVRRVGHRRAAARRPGPARPDHAHVPGDLLAGRRADRPAAVDRRDVRGGDRDRRRA